ncbi:uncharacterized protein LOC124261146 [Haliotis rubra]|uniref:uncharacterized protein LOC124261146 n=1 Tax=Haliotis rubra TaxID=36100 RepID=UPI001EE61788|nr:uncharacterized protein LOC124261146 [Haliotis rubra]
MASPFSIVAATGQPCKDVDVDCAEYDTTWCSDPKYEAWAIYKCPQHCSKCNVADLQSKPLTLCQDNVDCRLYGQTACGGTHQAWAQQHCPEYCGFCEGINRPPSHAWMRFLTVVNTPPSAETKASPYGLMTTVKTCGLCPVKDDADILLRS